MKCLKCNADITGMDSHICSGSTVAGISTDAIEFAIENMLHHYNVTNLEYVSAKEQLSAIVERCATLEQQISDAKLCDSCMQACKRCDYLSRIQQAEKRGWDLHEANHGSTTPAGNTYEQAVQERDGGWETTDFRKRIIPDGGGK